MKDKRFSKISYAILFFFTITSFSTYSQNNIQFDYDTAGNQVKMYFSVVKIATQQEAAYQEAGKEPALDEVAIQQNIEYYPNPVERELTLNWSKSTGVSVVSFQVFSIDNKLIKTLTPSKSQRQITFQFDHYANGIYLVKALFSNGVSETFKIIKK